MKKIIVATIIISILMSIAPSSLGGKQTSMLLLEENTLYVGGSGPGNPPVANFTFNPENPTEYDVIQFNDTSTDSDGTIVSWWWDFSDGNYSDLKNPTHSFGTAGIYFVRLTVRDDDDNNDSILKSVFVYPILWDLEIEIQNLNIGKVNAIIKNTGDAEVPNVNWFISIRGGLFNKINLTKTGSIDTLSSNEIVKVSISGPDSRIIRGFGRIEVTAEVKVRGGRHSMIIPGFILGRLIFVFYLGNIS